ncbi:mitochondrial antiviral-signaling protein [Patagioenas fasciata]|uniref:mitochondrial antiviral-signaling protein n=1 Tax=Patagioenas fasciata TaxID=372321 RepID=UPI0032E8AE71
MGFAEDKVYKYIIQNLGSFKNIRVASLADSLSCLTDADRDELHTREETRGSQATAYRFYQYLRCRQGWVQDLIAALRHNNAGDLADELQHVYDSWQPRPAAPAAASAAPTTASVPPAASAARPALSITAQTPSPGPNPLLGALLAEQPCRDLPVSGHSPLLPDATATTSTDLDARAPVQELVSGLPKKLEQESLQPPPPGSTVHDASSDGHDGEGHLPHPTEAVQVAAGPLKTGTMAVPSATTSDQGRDWLSRQQHPVCVDNGCFGNANHLHRGALGLGLGSSLLPRPVGAAGSPQQPRNEPEENFYMSTESPSRPEESARSRGAQPPASPPKQQAVPSSERDGPPSSFVDVRSPLLIKQQFDAEQKRVEMLQEHEADRDSSTETTTLVATLVPRDASLSCDTSLKPPVQEQYLPAGETASGSRSVPTEEKVLPASTVPIPTVTGSSEVTSGRTTSRVSSAIWVPCSSVEGHVEPSKPGVLLSTPGESPEAAGRCPSSRGPSGHHSRSSGSLTFSSDPLLMSTDSSSTGETLSRVSSGCSAPAARENTREKEKPGASGDSSPPSSWASTSLGTHEVRVDHYPSTQLRAGNDLQDGENPLGNPPVFDSSEVIVPCVYSIRPSLSHLMGIAAISALAFLVYTRLRK